MPTISIPGGQLAYSMAGCGIPACITHQYAQVSAADPLIETLAPYFTCYAINARGVGSSGPVRGPEDLTMEKLADDVEAARQALGVERWVMVGSSTGGMVALLYALRYPQAMLGMILVGTAASYRFFTGSLYDPRHPHATRIVEAYRSLAAGEPDSVERYARLVWTLSVANPSRTPPPRRATPFSKERLQAFVQHLRGFDIEDDLARITVPVLVISGRHDPQCPIENSERIAARIPHAQLVICEHSGHFPYIEEPDIFRATISRFAREHGFVGIS